jgi:glycosyltransferase involved in cell wall biosynthesis
MSEQPNPQQPSTRGHVCVLLAAHEHDEHLRACMESLERHTPADVPLERFPPTTVELNRALARSAPADVAILEQPCRVSAGWLERLQAAARADTNTASASALADAGGELALGAHAESEAEFEELAAEVADRTLALHPRLTRARGPCVYVRRAALELVGALDEELDLATALERDFAERCVLGGLSHIAADDVLVGRLADDESPPAAEPSPCLPDSGVLARALETIREPLRRLSVTLDARALDGTVTGTQVHVLELIVALAHTGMLDLRVLVRTERIDERTLRELRELPHTELLSAEQLEPQAPRTSVFHRPQQTFSPGDVALALSLGERFVLSQLDLIAYRNPGYFADEDSWGDYRRASRHGLSAAERVVVLSRHTRRELLADALVEDARIRVLAPGLDHRAAGEPSRPASAPDGDFLLCLGTDFRHKNRLFALRLAAALRERHDWRGSLVLAGTHIPIGTSRELEREFLEAHGELRDAVVELGAVSEPEKAWLIANAAALLYPSTYEGFGLVPFESALAGVPCVFAPVASLAEEAPAGTAAIVPWDAEASAAATHALLTDPAARSAHVETLAAAARELSWARTATAMVEIYREAALAPVRDAATLSRDLPARERRLSIEHELEVARLEGEREHAKRMYDELNAEVGDGLSLIGPHGALPEDLQRALLAISARASLRRTLFGALARAFALARAIRRYTLH